MGDIDLLSVQADSAAGGDRDGPVVKGILQLRQAHVGPLGGRVYLGRPLHLKSFVRPFVVELLNELVKDRLLLQAVGLGRPGRFLFEG